MANQMLWVPPRVPRYQARKKPMWVKQ
jgi:hypothetical protein